MKKRRYLAMVFAIVMTVLVITGCENGESVTTNPGTSSTTTTQKPGAKPTEATVAEPTEAASPTEVAEEPTPEPEDVGPVIEGIDFSGLIAFKDSMADVRNQCSFYESRLIFFDHAPHEGGKQKYKVAPFEDGGYAILKNAETYKRIPDHKFKCMLYTPKQIDKAILDNGRHIYEKERMSDNDFDLWAGYFDMDELKYEGGTVEHYIEINYDDGTSETFTFTITDQ